MELEDLFKEYMDCCAVLNYLRQEDWPDIAAMHEVIKRMEVLEDKLKDGGISR